MAVKQYDPAEVHAMWLKCGRNNVEAAKELGTTEATVRRLVAKVEDTGRVEKTKDHEIITLRNQLKTLQKQELTDARVQNEIIGLTKAPVVAPDWIEHQRGRGSHFAGVPTFFASDWHAGEVVRPAEIGGLNEYNLAIMEKRAETFVNVGIELLKDHMPKATYDGCVLALGGDMLSGDIHEELAQTNELESMPTLLKLQGTLITMIEHLTDEFGQLFVPCVTGNHGRTSRKPRFKRRNHTNYDWLLYNLLAKHFEKDKRITFLIPEGPDAFYRVYGTRYLLTHGDQFRGGDGMIGPIGPIFRGDKKKRSRNAETEFSYDIIIMGHWHQYIHLAQLIVNDTLKGYDEYAFGNNFPFAPAAQALWSTHPTHGVTYRMPVYVQRRPAPSARAWVSIKG